MAISLPEFITRTGESESAQLFGVKERTVQSWRRRERYPRANQAQRIVEVSSGEVDYAGIYGPDGSNSAATSPPGTQPSEQATTTPEAAHAA